MILVQKVPIAIFVATVISSPLVNADWVQWAGNGHYYQVVHAPDGVTYDQALVGAQNLGGHLATVTSAAEGDFIFSLADNPIYWYANVFNANIGPWLGGFQPEGSPEPGGGWQWVTGEPFTYTNWWPGEPNNSGGTENRLHLYSIPAPNRASLWNDVSDFVLINGYVVEAEAIPEPGSFVLFSSIGFLCLLRRHRTL
jgi:hypothetical protein